MKKVVDDLDESSQIFKRIETQLKKELAVNRKSVRQRCYDRCSKIRADIEAAYAAYNTAVEDMIYQISKALCMDYGAFVNTDKGLRMEMVAIVENPKASEEFQSISKDFLKRTIKLKKNIQKLVRKQRNVPLSPKMKHKMNDLLETLKEMIRRSNQVFKITSSMINNIDVELKRSRKRIIRR